MSPQLFPAVRIMEQALFVKSGKHNPQVSQMIVYNVLRYREVCC
jgi:hypothetical protein